MKTRLATRKLYHSPRGVQFYPGGDDVWSCGSHEVWIVTYECDQGEYSRIVKMIVSSAASAGCHCSGSGWHGGKMHASLVVPDGRCLRLPADLNELEKEPTK